MNGMESISHLVIPPAQVEGRCFGCGRCFPNYPKDATSTVKDLAIAILIPGLEV